MGTKAAVAININLTVHNWLSDTQIRDKHKIKTHNIPVSHYRLPLFQCWKVGGDNFWKFSAYVRKHMVVFLPRLLCCIHIKPSSCTKVIAVIFSRNVTPPYTMIKQNTWLHTTQTDITRSKWATQGSQKMGILLKSVFKNAINSSYYTAFNHRRTSNQWTGNNVEPSSHSLILNACICQQGFKECHKKTLIRSSRLVPGAP